MATNIISASNSQTPVTISAPTGTVTTGAILNNIHLANSSTTDFKSEYVTVATPTSNASDMTIRLTSMGEISGVGTGWRIRNNIGTDINGMLGAYRQPSFEYELVDGYDTFVLSSIFATHILKTSSGQSIKAAGPQDFLTSTPEVGALDKYRIIGSEFDDILSAGNNGDTIIGNLGSDSLTGGAGDDFFSYSPDTITDAGFGPNSKIDIINNFTKNSDKIELTDGLVLGSSEGQVQFDTFFSNTLIGITDGNGDVQPFALVDSVTLDNSDFVLA